MTADLLVLGAGTDCKERLKPLVAVLPNENFIVLKYLCSFLHRVSLNEDSNRMNSFSLGIVFGPNIFRSGLNFRFAVLTF